MAQDINYWSLIEPVWLPLNVAWDEGPDEFVRLYRSIRPEIGHLYAGHWCQSEVHNGGLHQFFDNTTGLLAPEALEGYRAIGATVWAEVLAEAMKFFGTPYPRDREDRQAVLSRKKRSVKRVFDPRDDRFYDWDDWEDTANAYARRLVASNETQSHRANDVEKARPPKPRKGRLG